MAFPFEINPFALSIPTNAPIKSITVGSNLDWLDVPVIVTGENATLPINSKTVNPLKVLGTLAAAGIPSMISLTPAHIPTIEISQVSGLQAAINSLVKTLASANTFLTVSNNGIGGYTLTVNTGTSGATVAVGNDTRFPASVTGLRKGAGVGSADTAATAKTDYWNTDVFVASGASHARGLVPDPGASAGAVKFLREDASWQTPAGSGTVTSAALTMPSEFSVAGSPITNAGTFAVTKANQAVNRIYAGPASGGAAAPAFRFLVFNDVAGFVGAGAGNITAGNDIRLTSSVTGIRKSSGYGSTDVAAVSGVDYWDATNFSNGPGHQAGLVPDPGNTGTTTKYLREDGTWQTFTPGATTISLTMLATQADKTLLANASGGTASPTAVTAKTSRSGSLLGLESITTFGNANYTALATDKYVATSVNFTATRTVQLPLANTFNPSQQIIIADDFGAINGVFVLNITRQGADTIQGSSAALVLRTPKGSYTLSSDGVSKWSVIRRSPSIIKTFFTSNATYTTPTGIKSLFVEVIGGGGGGGGALGAGSQAAVGGGAGAGGYANTFIGSPAVSYVMTIGAAGSGGVGAAAGATGGTTSFGSVAIAQGGNGGDFLPTGTSAAFVLPGFGGSSTAGDIQVGGAVGTHGQRVSGTLALSGSGASVTPYSNNAPGLFVSEANGNSGSGYGGGGGGALSYSTNAKTGGAGLQGVIIVTEYY